MARVSSSNVQRLMMTVETKKNVHDSKIKLRIGATESKLTVGSSIIG